MKSLPLLLVSLISFTTICYSEDQWVYFGTYTKGESEGIYVAPFDSKEGKLGKPRLIAKMDNPSFLAVRPGEKSLFAVSEGNDGSVSSFSVDSSSGELVFQNSQPTKGAHPCHVSTDANGDCLLVANYSSGNVVSYSIQKDGKLSPPVSNIQHEGSSVNKKRQAEPHAHSINPGVSDRYAYAADLGADRIFIYQLNSGEGTITPSGEVKVEPGAGPRHFSLHPSGKFAYVINELLLTVNVFQVDKNTGGLKEIHTVSTLPPDTKPVGSTAEIRVHPNGRFLYGSNRGHDTIVVYKIDQENGKLTWIENEPIQGNVPRNFAIDLTGKYLFAAGQKSGTVSVFLIDEKTGGLTFTGEQLKVSDPVCIRFIEKK